MGQITRSLAQITGHWLAPGADTVRLVIWARSASGDASMSGFSRHGLRR
ncbi:MAG: hypothetical protein RLP09_33755 [Sandaracinaceae bacterium]